MSANLLNDNQVSCDAPPQTPGLVNLTILDNEDVLAAHFFLYQGTPFSPSLALINWIDIIVDDVTPTTGRLAGGTTLRITGSNFIDESFLACRFGSTIVPATLNGTDLFCDTPSVAAPIEIIVEVTNNGQDFVSTGIAFFFRDVSILGISPSNGFSAGGTIITASGSGFADNATIVCRFGGVNVTMGSLVSDTEVECLAPPGVDGNSTTIEISINNGVEYSQPLVYTYQDIDAGSLSIDVFNGPTSGGTIITVTSDSDFLDVDTIACRFNGDTVQSASFLDPSTIQCSTPSGFSQNQQVSVEVTNNRQEYADTRSSFRFFDIGVIDVSPRNGKSAGNTTVTIEVDALPPGMRDIQCQFDSVVVSPSSIIGNTIECLTPTTFNDEDVASVRITGNGVDFFDSGFDFQFLDAKPVTFNPNTTPTSKATTFTIIGTGFIDGSVECIFEGVFRPATFDSMTGSVTCENPTDVENTTTNAARALRVTNNGGIDQFEVGMFYYHGTS